MKMPLLLPLLAVSALVAGCIAPVSSPLIPTPTPLAQQIPFETISFDEWGDADLAADKDPMAFLEPMTFLITSAADIGPISSRISPELLATLEQISYEKECVLALFRGLKGSSGYKTEIRRISVQGGRLVVNADFFEPGEDGEAAAETSPHHIVKFMCALLSSPFADLTIELVPLPLTPTPPS